AVRAADVPPLGLGAEDVFALGASAGFGVLSLPGGEVFLVLARREFGERKVVARRVADDSCDAARGPAAVRRLRRPRIFGRVRADARVIVVEDEDAFVIRVALAAHAQVVGTEVAVGDVSGRSRLVARDRLAAPRPVLPVRRDDHPLLAQRMPTFLPNPATTLLVV